MLIDVSFQYDGWLPDNLFSLNDVDVVEVLFLAMLPFL